ncbi:MAG: biopolymer transporter ExbD [Pseudomonadota bacterium]
MTLDSHRVRPPLDFSLTSVNLVFLLLLFFLTAGTIMQQAETTIDAPATETLPLERLPRPLLVIDAEGGLFLDGQATTVDAIVDGRVSGANNEANGPASVTLPQLHVLPDRSLSARRFLTIVKALRANGTRRVTLVTVRE